jgi:hypothetical protein
MRRTRIIKYGYYLPKLLTNGRSSYCPSLRVEHLLSLQILNATLVDELLSLAVHLDLEGHGRSSGDMSLHIYRQEALRREHAKVAWMPENYFLQQGWLTFENLMQRQCL